MKKIAMILAFAAGFCVACENDDTTQTAPASEIELTDFDSSDVSLRGGTVDVTVNSNGLWRLTGKKTWCRPSAVEGEDGAMVTFTVAPNDTGESRSIVYKFFCGNKTVPFTVTQEAANIFILESPKEVTVDTSGGIVTVKYSTSVDFDYVIEDNAKGWIAGPATRAMEPGRVSFTVKANSDPDARTGQITFKADGMDYPVTITQKQLNTITLEKSSYDLEADGGELKVALSANIDYTIGTSDWIHHVPAANRAMSDKEETFTIDPTDAPRTGRITFYGSDGKTNKEVTINQTAPEVEAFEFPDSYFVTYLKFKKYIMDAPGMPGKYLITEAGLAATKFTFVAHAIVTIKGIEAFPNLKQLEGNMCKVQKFELASSPVWEIYMPNANNLGPNIVVSGENLTDVRFSNCGGIVTIDVSESPKLKALNLSGCAKLTTIYMKAGQVVESVQKPGTANIVYK